MLSSISAMIPVAIGLISGIGSSAPLGPTNFWVAQTVICGRREQLWFFVVGVICADVVYASIAFHGYSYLLHEGWVGRILGAVAVVALIVMGVHTLRCKTPTLATAAVCTPNVAAVSLLKEFGIGFVMCAANPTFILFWVFVASLIHQSSQLMTPKTIFMANVGIVIGDLLWYNIFAKLVHHGIGYLEQHWLEIIQKGIGWILIISGVLAGYGIFKY